MKKEKTTELDFLSEFREFIMASQKGSRTKKDGSKILKTSLEKYSITYKALKDFSEKKQFHLRIQTLSRNNKRTHLREKKYWKKFYQKFTDYLYTDLNCFDNYVGSVVKDIKIFFNYLAIERNILTGNYYKSFYVYQENIQILTLLPEQLNYLIHDKNFEEKLRPLMRKVKDILVAGCTVSLRYSDLINLKTSNLEMVNQEYYLRVQSKKTKVYTRIKLPIYVVEIFKKYSKRSRQLLPYFNLVGLNGHLKRLAECAGWTDETIKMRQKRGKAVIIYKDPLKKSHFRFCDLMSSHIMRRTAITTMLRLQMPEHLVKKISGHAPDSREFHKYVNIAQNYLDDETDKVFYKLNSLRSA